MWFRQCDCCVRLFFHILLLRISDAIDRVKGSINCTPPAALPIHSLSFRAVRNENARGICFWVAQRFSAANRFLTTQVALATVVIARRLKPDGLKMPHRSSKLLRHPKIQNAFASVDY